jgi:outer membrane protein TolC
VAGVKGSILRSPTGPTGTEHNFRFRTVCLGIGLAALTLALPAAVVCAQTAPAASTAEASPDSALQQTLQEIAGEPLRLSDALSEALARSPAVQSVLAEIRAADGLVRREQGAFDPGLFGEVERTTDDSPTASFFAGANVLETRGTRAEAGARWRLPFGTELSASLNTTRLETNSAFATLSPQHDTFGRLEIVHPLLKGFGRGSRAWLDAAEQGLSLSEARYADVRFATVADVERLYWALFAAERDHAVQILIRDQAEAFLKEAQLRADAGLAGPGATASARVFFVQQSQTALDTEELYDRISDQLASLIGRRPVGDPQRFHPIDQPPAAFPAFDEEALVTTAQARSLQVAAAERGVAIARALAAGARTNALPQLDLFGSLGGRGLAGTGREVIFDFGGGPDTLTSDLDTGLGDTVDQVLGRDFPTWSLGLRFAVPFGGGDKGERDRLEAEVTRAEQQLEYVRRELEATVRAQVRGLERGQTRLALASEGVVASLEQVRIGRLEFRSGRTTTFELVRLGADLADAQRRYSTALVRTAESAAMLRRLTAGAYPDPGPLADILEESTP